VVPARIASSAIASPRQNCKIGQRIDACEKRAENPVSKKLSVEVQTMPAETPLELMFEAESSLEVRVRMASPHRQFEAGKLGYLWRDRFDWKGKRWRLQFLAVVKRRQTETTHGMLEEVRERVPRVPSGLVLDTKGVESLFGKFAKWAEVSRLNQERREAGWKLRKLASEQEIHFASLLHASGDIVDHLLQFVSTRH
jgi:hypothetical protein